jgi:hypothetical protein
VKSLKRHCGSSLDHLINFIARKGNCYAEQFP